MHTILVTGASSFLGYHVAKRLNEAGIRPRVLERPESKLDALEALDVERCPGHLDDASAVRSACTGVATLLHVAFKVSFGGGAPAQNFTRDGNTLTAPSASGAPAIAPRPATAPPPPPPAVPQNPPGSPPQSQ